MGTAVRVGVTEPGSDAERLEELTLLLRQELLGLDVDSVEPQRGGEAPEGTRGAGAAIAGALVVSLQPTLQLVTALVSVVGEWARRGRRTVRIEIDGDVLELSGTTSELQQRLVDDWISKHAAER